MCVCFFEELPLPNCPRKLPFVGLVSIIAMINEKKNNINNITFIVGGFPLLLNYSGITLESILAGSNCI